MNDRNRGGASTTYSGPSGVKIFVLDPHHIRLQFEPGNGAIIQADLTAAEAQWVADELLARLKPAKEGTPSWWRRAIKRAGQAQRSDDE